ncbi:hypothetical protein ANCDUO_09521 [Ancylostoma duodenale]|uniref:Uncharacterized protein n=1 Tax=Ancylostoma duodenale TaxID=51022 RepID=A0A0C2GMI9_9BILA|nr:hypothetical protein ANCDUO_09521 [Ancylostoma duodenale]
MAKNMRVACFTVMLSDLFLSVVSNHLRGDVLKNQLIEKKMKEQNEQQSGKFVEIPKRTTAEKRLSDTLFAGEGHALGLLLELRSSKVYVVV